MGQDEIISQLGWLIDDWCEVRNLKALRRILPVYPLPGEAPANWERLREALHQIQQDCADEFLPSGTQTLKDLIGAVDQRTAC